MSTSTAGRRRVIGYTRVSTAEQATAGVSLAAQRAKLAQYAELFELELVGVIEDAGASAKTLDRPGLQRALELLRTGAAGGLLVAKLDRLTRSVRDLDALLCGPFKKAELLSVSEQIDTATAAGRLVLNVLASVSQWEREAIGERTSTAMQHKARNGEYTGGRVPYGYRLADDGVRLIEDGEEQDVLRQIRELRDGGASYRAICVELSDRGISTRTGGAWNPGTIKRLCAA